MPDSISSTESPDRPATSTSKAHKSRSGAGRAQLSLVEHALCPLDPASSLREHLVHETTYGYTDRNGHLKLAQVHVLCPSGLSATDEFVLWGLLAITFSQPEASPEFHATPHFCLRRLGLIDRKESKGGKDYQLFRESIKRLARVIYENTAFYDPIRGEHRDVAFGFLKYSLPIEDGSSREWRFVWDQQFFELCQATGGGLWFDLETYRRLDCASRRLFILLQKIFHRSAVSPAFDVRRLCVDGLGFAPTIDMRNLKIKLRRCLERLAEQNIVCDPDASTEPLFRKQGVSRYSVTLTRGPYFEGERCAPTPLSADDSPLVDPLRSIGFDDASIRRILRDYRAHVIREWADITLAAREHHGESFFKKSPAAYFMDNLQHAAAGQRTPPDWWRDMRREELRRQHAADAEQLRSLTAATAETNEEIAFRAYLEGEARQAFADVTDRLAADFVSHGKTPAEARESGAYMARLHFLNRFRRAHPELYTDEFVRVDPTRLRDNR
jgi:hypothetical protein